MINSFLDVISGSVILVVCDIMIDGFEIYENDIFGMVDGKILVFILDMEKVFKDIFDKMIDEDSEIVIIYVGEDGK